MTPGPGTPGRKPKFTRAQRAWGILSSSSFSDIREFLKLMYPEKTPEERAQLGLDLIKRLMT